MFLAWSIVSGNFRPLRETLQIHNLSYHLEFVKDNYWVLVVRDNIRVEAYRNILLAIRKLDPIPIESDSQFVNIKLGG